jgi:hypothetical protein
MTMIRRVTSVVALLAIGVWLGGLVALGAIAAPVVFAIVPMPASADAMTVVFRRFDLVAMACAALLLGAEATRINGPPLGTIDRVRIAVGALAAALAVFEATAVSPRIAALHAGAAVRGIGAAGGELARLHDIAEAAGKAQLVLLVIVLVFQVLAASPRVLPEAAGRSAPRC